MKKAKIMLLAITVLAVVGGALAFKARTFNEVDLCITEVPAGHGCGDVPPNACIRMANLTATEDVVNAPNFCYTTTEHELECGTNCIFSATLVEQD